MIRIAWTGLCWEVRRGGRGFQGTLCGTFRPLMRGRNWTGWWAAAKPRRRGGVTHEHRTASFLEAARYALRGA